jgi:5-methylcytosine-specific restriction protein B
MSLGDTNHEDDSLYEESLETGRLYLGYGHGLDFTGCATFEQIAEKVRTKEPDAADVNFNIAAMQRFKNDMQVGDIVVISDGNKKFRAIGRVAGGYEPPRADGLQQRQVRWLRVFDTSLPFDRILHKPFSQMSIYRLRDHILKAGELKALLHADPMKPQNHVLIVDEINRGNVSKILGELITLLEPDKRLGARNELTVTLPHSGDRFGVPSNLFLIGTMNTADRSIAFLDTALRRRFEFVELMPDPAVIAEEVGTVGGIDVAALLKTINERIELLYDRDHAVGHAFFVEVETLTDLRRVFVNKVIPLLQEYFYGDHEKVAHVLGCPFDAESGKPSANAAPLLSVTRLDARGLLTNADAIEPRSRCAVNPAFLDASETKLSEYFAGVLRKAAPAPD